MRKLTKKYYNTNGLEGEELREAMRQATRQEVRVYDIFVKAKRRMTPFDVLDVYVKLHKFTPITSIRRAITNLTNDEMLVKTEVKGEGRYGSPNYYWEIAQNG